MRRYLWAVKAVYSENIRLIHWIFRFALAVTLVNLALQFGKKTSVDFFSYL